MTTFTPPTGGFPNQETGTGWGTLTFDSGTNPVDGKYWYHASGTVSGSSNNSIYLDSSDWRWHDSSTGNPPTDPIMYDADDNQIGATDTMPADGYFKLYHSNGTLLATYDMDGLTYGTTTHSTGGTSSSTTTTTTTPHRRARSNFW